MKEMNMNTVRSSHYVPDKRFLELCDSLGLFVLDEVTGWQQGYDTIVGPKLIRETVLKDENHPSVVIWNHGNEGGWDFANEKAFQQWDIQQRPVIYPWLLRNGVETHHYPEYNYGIGRNVFGNDPFMATELLHGLYDGGHGAGLEDFWRSYESTPLLAGGFLWVLADEAVLRKDLDGTVFDSDGNNAPDGILGPHREKEGSFYTVKEIWSPVQIEPVTINRQWNGRLILKNKFIYTNLSDCSFNWKAFRTEIGSTEKTVTGAGAIRPPEAKPGESAMVTIDAGNSLQQADIFEFTAIDHRGDELYTWSWPVIQPDQKALDLFSTDGEVSEIVITENEETVSAVWKRLKFTFVKENGRIHSIENSNGPISLSGGPFPVGIESDVTGTSWELDKLGKFTFEVNYSSYPESIVWTLTGDGILRLEAGPLSQRLREIDYIGISFNYPEEKCKSVSWMGRGPYRVWKNRIKGSNLGIWEKAHNNTITGHSFNSLEYPEFKGYHGNLYWARLETTESPITIVSATPNLFFQLFTPEYPEDVRGGVAPPFPEGDLSFLYHIPAIGTKFKNAEVLGPQSQKGIYRGHRGDVGYQIKLWFMFE
jgi:hypothetical protein